MTILKFSRKMSNYIIDYEFGENMISFYQKDLMTLKIHVENTHVSGKMAITIVKPI